METARPSTAARGDFLSHVCSPNAARFCEAIHTHDCVVVGCAHCAVGPGPSSWLRYPKFQTLPPERRRQGGLPGDWSGVATWAANWRPWFKHALPSCLEDFDTQVKEPEAVIRMEEAILRKIEAIPGVKSAGISTGVPMSNNRNMDPVFIENRPFAEGQMPPLRRFRAEWGRCQC